MAKSQNGSSFDSRSKLNLTRKKEIRKIIAFVVLHFKVWIELQKYNRFGGHVIIETHYVQKRIDNKIQIKSEGMSINDDVTTTIKEQQSEYDPKIVGGIYGRHFQLKLLVQIPILFLDLS